jgi:hypothetical protein
MREPCQTGRAVALTAPADVAAAGLDERPTRLVVSGDLRAG